MTDRAHERRPDRAASTAPDERLNAWNARLIAVITDCEDDVRRYRDIIERINGERDCNTAILACCMKNDVMHRHLAIFTGLHLVGLRFEQACASAGAGNHGLMCANARLRQHIELLCATMRALFRQLERGAAQTTMHWNYENSLLGHLTARCLQVAVDEAISSLHAQFSCSLTTALMAAIEPAMKSVQDRLSLRPELPLDVKAFAGAMLGLKCNYDHRAPIGLADLASDISQILKIPRTICLSP